VSTKAKVSPESAELLAKHFTVRRKQKSSALGVNLGPDFLSALKTKALAHDLFVFVL